MKISVVGAGAFGTALAIALARTGDVLLWARNSEHADAIARTGFNDRHLPGCKMPDAVRPVSDPAELASSDIVLLCVPTQQLTSFLKEHSVHLAGATLIACCKGIDLATGDGPIEVIQRHVSDAHTAVLTGPSFAADIARGLPTALTIACADDAFGKHLQKTLTRPTLRLYRTTDVSGAQLGGALKNVIAIAAGATIGSGLGDSARAAVITRGYAEMQKFAALRGAQPETLMGLSGLGDLILTCSSELSRNYSFGLALGQGAEFDANKTVEGAFTAQAVAKIALEHNLEMPISAAVNDLVAARANVADVLRMLLSRPLKEE